MAAAMQGIHQASGTPPVAYRNILRATAHPPVSTIVGRLPNRRGSGQAPSYTLTPDVIRQRGQKTLPLGAAHLQLVGAHFHHALLDAPHLSQVD